EDAELGAVRLRHARAAGLVGAVRAGIIEDEDLLDLRIHVRRNALQDGLQRGFGVVRDDQNSNSRHSVSLRYGLRAQNSTRNSALRRFQSVRDTRPQVPAIHNIAKLSARVGNAGPAEESAKKSLRRSVR